MYIFVGKKDYGSADFKLPDILTIIPLSDLELQYCADISSSGQNICMATFLLFDQFRQKIGT